MAKTAIILITLVNAVLVFILSLFAITGDGSSTMMGTIQSVGFIWVAVTCGFSLSKCSKGNGRAGVVLASLTVPVGLFAAIAAIELWSMKEALLRKNEATPKEVTEMCQSAGAKFLAKPSKRVQSIAFDWQTKFDWARMSYINSDAGKFGQFRFLHEIKYPETIQFIEQKARRNPQSEKQFPYERKPTAGEFVGVPELTADVLVTYDYKKLSKSDARNSYLLTDIVVSDRRSGEVLATLQYVTGDKSNWPICGETSPGEINIAEFIFKATGARTN